MGEIKITPGELRTLAVKMQDSLILTENLKNNVYRATEEIRGGTENSMAHNISSKMVLLNREIAKLYDYLDKHSFIMNKAADDFEESERRIIEEERKIEEYNRHHEDYRSISYDTVDYEDYILNQQEYSPYYYDNGYNCGCTVTCWAMLIWLQTKTKPVPQDYWKDNVGCNWGGGQPKEHGDQSSMIKRAYDIVKDGKPCVFYAYNLDAEGKHTSEHAVLVVGINHGADPDHLSASDILVVDPWDGTVKSLSETWCVNYSNVDIHYM